MKRHWLTTLFGFLLAFSQAAIHTPSIVENKTLDALVNLTGAVAAIGLGAAAADSRKVPNGKNPLRSDTR